MMTFPARLAVAWLCLALLSAMPARAGDVVSGNADARFDRTGDGLVDAEDWGQLSEAERQAYARDSLLELGLEPDAAVGNGQTRLQDYLDGLRAVYGR